MNTTTLLQKKEALAKAKAILNQEFIGLENIINTIIDSITAWYLFPEIQDRPLLVNLWGLTGVGKSSLVNRLSALLGYEKRYYRFDLGNKANSSWDIELKLQDIANHQNGQSFIIGFDEFQHAKTIDEFNNERNESPHRLIWDVLDSGKLNVNNRSRSLSQIYFLCQELKYALQIGIKVENGLVVTHKDKFIKLSSVNCRIKYLDNGDEMLDTEELMFVPAENNDKIYELWPERFNNEYEVRDYLTTLDGPQTISFLEEVIEAGLSPKVVDCSKALIFIMGNLDEAYHMSKDFNPDINADEFYEQSKKINVAQIKQALRKRFRSEQIARLGNLHIIYPSFSQNSYYKLIAQELERLKTKHEKLSGLKINFNQSVLDVIYREGVYPTQGIRPLLTTVHYLFGAQLVKIHAQKLETEQIDEVELHEAEGNLTFTFKYNSQIVLVKNEKLELNLEKLRESRKDDMQAITAVHEAGHIVLSMALLHQLPEYAYSVTADQDSGGFVFSKNKTKYISKKQIVRRAAALLGGLMAEKIVFGDENITNGAERDLYQATRLVSDLINESGMGNFLGAISVKSPQTTEYLFEENVGTNRELMQVMQASAVLAERTLEKEKALLLKLSEHLAENRVIKKEQIKEMLCKYAKSIELSKVLNEDAEGLYKKLLSNQIAKLSLNQQQLSLPGFVLNQNVSDKNA